MQYNKYKKILRYFRIYGPIRTIMKVAGRTRNPKLRFFYLKLMIPKKGGFISLIGCGQLGFTAISYFLYLHGRNRFLQCYDINEKHSKATAKFWNFKAVGDPAEIFRNEACKLIYIASNHASHTPYAIQALERGIDIYLEKPVSVDRGQIKELFGAIKESSSKVFVGYNRPFSKAVEHLVGYIKGNNEPFSLGCFVTGHFLEPDHWYRDPKEGTRICGNMGHWIDLSIHLMAMRGKIPSEFNINISYASKDNTDDDVIVTYSTNFKDITTICLTARSEPFEGINETINFQSKDFIAKIDDFRSIKTWNGSTVNKKRFWPKDTGQKKSIQQPFLKQERNFEEVAISSLLMLEIKDMVEKGEHHRVYEPLNDPIYLDFIK